MITRSSCSTGLELTGSATHRRSERYRCGYAHRIAPDDRRAPADETAVRSLRSGTAMRAAHDGDPVRGARGEQLVGIDLAEPAEEVPLGLVRRSSRRPPPLRWRRLGPPCGELLEPALGLLGRRPFCVSLAHRGILITLGLPPRGPPRRARRRRPPRRGTRPRRACRRSRAGACPREHLHPDDLEHERAADQDRRDPVEADAERERPHAGLGSSSSPAGRRRSPRRRARRARTRSSARRSRRSGRRSRASRPRRR